MAFHGKHARKNEENGNCSVFPDKQGFVGNMTGEGTGNREQGTGSAAAALSIANIGIIGR